jgi:hypothetical protein
MVNEQKRGFREENKRKTEAKMTEVGFVSALAVPHCLNASGQSQYQGLRHPYCLLL